MRPRAGEQRVDIGEVELPLGRLDLFPGNRDLQRVGVEPRHHRPDLRQDGGIIAAVVGLHAQHQE
ncbi:MAG: hypothetical protein PGN08_13885, partial [Sphingomonas taxi]